MRFPPVRRWIVVGAALAMAGCGTLQPDTQMAAFSTQITGLNQVPPVATRGSGELAAVLDKDTRLLRWKLLSLSGLSGPATAAHFHGPAGMGTNATVKLLMKNPVMSPSEGQATLTPAQVADLMAGKWYVNIHTAAHPAGEIRGQVNLRE